MSDPLTERGQRLYRITRSTSKTVWLRWSALGDNPPRGMSIAVPMTEFAEKWEQVTAGLYGRRINFTKEIKDG